MNSGVYKIQSKCKPEKFYIGSAKHLKYRWSTHLNLLRKNKHHSSKLQNHYNKYGEEDLVFIIIEPCFPDFLIIREQYYFDTLHPNFNICKIAGSCLGTKHSEETKRNWSNIRKGHRGWNKGKIGMVKHTEEHKKKMSDLKKGVPRSPETIIKMREGMLKRNQALGIVKKSKKIPEDEKIKHRKVHSLKMSGIGNPMYGKHHTAKTKEKMRQYVKTDEHKEHISKSLKGKQIGINNPFFGKHHSKEQKAKWSKIRTGIKPSEITKEKRRQTLANKPPMSEEERIKHSEIAKIVNHKRWHDDSSYDNCPKCHNKNEQYKKIA